MRGRCRGPAAASPRPERSRLGSGTSCPTRASAPPRTAATATAAVTAPAVVSGASVAVLTAAGVVCRVRAAADV